MKTSANLCYLPLRQMTDALKNCEMVGVPDISTSIYHALAITPQHQTNGRRIVLDAGREVIETIERSDKLTKAMAEATMLVYNSVGKS